jgi:tRNA threonylcarbamoyladenosine biosynthesis protein TsaE
MVTLISRNPDETFALGEQWGRDARAGWVVGLSGDLGAGKTQLVKGFAHGLGSPARVHSPTFALLNDYPGGRLPLFHLDLYRLNHPADVVGAGLEEYLLRPNGVAIVEWIERWLDGTKIGTVMGPTRLVHIETLSETERQISYEDLGA